MKSGLLLSGLLAVAPLASAPAVSAAPAVTAAQKPNVVFILCDDMGQRDLGCYGSTFYETPHIDRLAQDGMKFSQAYAACAVCSPTRASLLTGKYPVRIPLTDYLKGQRKAKLLPATYKDELPLEEVTLAESLKAGGYATAHMGKWHLGEMEQFWPEHQGFDVNVGGTKFGTPPSYFSPYKNPRLSDGPNGEYLTDRLTDEAEKFIEGHKDKPFFLQLWHYAPHNPMRAKDALIEKFRAKKATLPADVPLYAEDSGRQVRQVQEHAIYAAMLASIDESTGRIVKKLADLGLDKNTIVIFTSDNGGLSTAEGTPTSNLPLRAGKGWAYEGGVRVPLLVKWPGNVKPNSVCETPVTSTDFYPTLLAAAGLPSRPQQHLDGVNILPLLRGETVPASIAERPLYWHYPHYGNQGGAPYSAVRQGDWKLIEWLEDNRLELYNLRGDLSEKRDLAAAQPEKTAALVKQLRVWRTGVNANMPSPNPEFKPIAPQL